MRSFAYLHPGHTNQEISVIRKFCRENKVELVSFFIDAIHEPHESLESRQGLGTMLDKLQAGEADCAMALVNPDDPTSLQVRFCGYATCCCDQANAGVCRSGAIAAPSMCIFQ